MAMGTMPTVSVLNNLGRRVGNHMEQVCECQAENEIVRAGLSHSGGAL